MSRENELEKLLRESLDWLCPHDDARKAWEKGCGRAWCRDCQHYIRSDEDLSLRKRIYDALAGEGDGG